MSAFALRPWILTNLPTEDHPPPRDQKAFTPPTIPEAAPRSPTVQDIQAILEDHDHGYPLAVIAKRSGIDQGKCEHILEAARAIAEIKSNKGKSRFFSKGRLNRSSGRLLLSPSMPVSDQDKQLAVHMIERIRPLLSKNGALGDIGPAIELFLERVEANNAGVRFYTPEEAAPFVALVREITDNPGMIFGTHVTSERSRLDASEQRAGWKKGLGISVRADGNGKSLKREGGRYGKLVVSLELPNEKGHFVSAHAYKYVLHLAAIALLSRQRIQIPGEPEDASNTMGDHG